MEVFRRRRRRGEWWLTLLVALLFSQPPKGHAKARVFNIFWNTTNPMFRIDNTDNVIDVNRGNSVFEYDQAHIICPVYPAGTRPLDAERYIIYSVTKEEFEQCRLIHPNPRVIAVCNKPHRLLYVTITFRSFTPTPGGLEFKPGQDYYFLSTSSHSDIERRVGGRCSTNNMKMMFKIAPLKGRREQSSSSSSVDGPGMYGDGDGDEYLYATDDFDFSSNSVEHEKRSEDYESHGVAFRQEAAKSGRSADLGGASAAATTVMMAGNLAPLCLCAFLARTLL